MIDIKDISYSLGLNRAKAYSKYMWILVAFFPFLFQLPSTEVPVWSIGLILGGVLANKYPLRWIALAWVIALIFPLLPFLLLACSGILIRDWRQCIYAAMLGFSLSFVTVPALFNHFGFLLILLGLVSIVLKKIK